MVINITSMFSDDVYIGYLPLAHVLELAAGIYLSFVGFLELR